ncbi:MAG: alpha/beta hydrolase [Betaproteobacteria bacterium]|nr:alpha/beta hydrolase [Betaproteobacteria bacterium]MBK7593353.1 alpha/beta hydrolase [Betaproteobacteria bacterium]MBK7793629.1 alpha/beta hydrolase [Betaproteobacteria bacterium]MBK8689208.1 alpha/beta hydrolase [Betaproteobacteria bacterium]MBK9675346.1 alpha/beta hydrolase [Betaproteobacteria bacterium]
MKHFAADDGESIHVEIAGAGTPLVLLHGWTASHQEWSPLVAALARHHQVIRWDARGHGGHPLAAATRPTVRRMAQDLRNLLDHYALRDVVLVGHSMGALTIWEYLRAFGTAGVRKLCLIDQSPRLVTDDDWALGIYGDFDRGRAEAFAGELRADFTESVLRLAAHGLNARARSKYDENAKGWQRVRETLQRLDPAPLIDIWSSLTAADYRDVLERIDVPTLLVWGGASNFYGLATAQYVHEHIRGSTLHVYEDTDHSPHQWQRERFERDLLSFVAR